MIWRNLKYSLRRLKLNKLVAERRPFTAMQCALITDKGNELIKYIFTVAYIFVDVVQY
jgi:hypothetical protein